MACERLHLLHIFKFVNKMFFSLGILRFIYLIAFSTNTQNKMKTIKHTYIIVRSRIIYVWRGVFNSSLLAVATQIGTWLVVAYMYAIAQWIGLNMTGSMCLCGARFDRFVLFPFVARLCFQFDVFIDDDDDNDDELAEPEVYCIKHFHHAENVETS